METSRAELRSLTTQLRSVVSEISAVVEQANQMGDVRAALEAAQNEEKAVLASMAASTQQTSSLQALQNSHATLASREATITHAKVDLERWTLALADALDSIPVLPVASAAASDADPVEVAREALGRSKGLVSQAISELNAAVARLDSLAATNAAKRIKLDEQSRSLRQSLEVVQRGASAASRRVQTLQEQLGQLGALETVETTRKYQLSELSHRREGVFEELVRLRDLRYDERQSTAKSLTADLGPRIRVDVTKSSLDGAYASAILAALRGTGMHAKELAPLLAGCMTPLELVQAVESDDPKAIASATGLTLDRAIRVVQSLRDGDTAEIISADIDDDAEMFLLDGADYKPTDALSMGQRCSVILPVLLNTAETLLVIDQPEDHLDNAYVVDTLVRSLRARSSHSQTIITTHNANIPVLGEAAHVIQLGSDGESGFQLACGQLRDEDVVDAITSVMEGGAEAFSRRASFYGLP